MPDETIILKYRDEREVPRPLPIPDDYHVVSVSCDATGLTLTCAKLVVTVGVPEPKRE